MDWHPRLILIPAAGMSARFAAEGFTGPKALLTVEYKGRKARMIDHLLSRIPLGFNPVIITREEWVTAFSRFAPCVGIKDSLGQTDTIAQAMLPKDEPFYVQNCDVLFDASIYRRIESSTQNETRIVLHKDDRPATAPPIFSYVDNPRMIQNIREKQRISDWAVSGLWRIASSKAFLNAWYTHKTSDVRHNGETYLSDTLTMMSGEKMGFAVVNYEMTDFGTPEAIARAGGKIVTDSALHA